MTEELEKRKEKLINFVKTHVNLAAYAVLTLIIWVTVWIRTRNIPLLEGKYIPDIDSYYFLRLSRYIAEHGTLFAIDAMRNFPLGVDITKDLVALPYVLAYIYKILSQFIPTFTIVHAAIVYPIIFFVLGSIAFFFFVRKTFDARTAILATALLTTIPAYLYRTMAGVADKEPLGMFLLFVTFYLYLKALYSESNKKRIFFAASSGLTTGLLALTWGGVQFVIGTMAAYHILEVLLNRFGKNLYYTYLPWWLVVVFMITQTTSRYGNISLFFTSFLFGATTLALFLALTNSILRSEKFNFTKNFKQRYPTNVISVAIGSIALLLLSTLLFGSSFITAQASAVYRKLTGIGFTRWLLTVAESHQPFYVEWASAYSKFFVWLFLIGTVVLFYYAFAPVQKYRSKLTAFFALFLGGFVFSRYAPSPVKKLDAILFLLAILVLFYFAFAKGINYKWIIAETSILILAFIVISISPSTLLLNGTSPTALFILFGSGIMILLVLIYYYCKAFYKDKETLSQFNLINPGYLFSLIYFLLMVVAAKLAIRFLFVLAPPAAITGAFVLIKIYDASFKIEKIKLNNIAKLIIKLAVWAFLLWVLYVTLFKFARSDYDAARFTGPSYDRQWQNAMQWVRDNTPKDSVFAHWWDYGYWVQEGGERATVLDGGNFIVWWNHLMGRHVLTGNNSEDALKFLVTHNATHLLIISDEIGKYGAYSSIGSDINFDRAAQILTSVIDYSQTQEGRNETYYLYRGGIGLDDNFVFNGQLLPAGSAAIGGTILPVRRMDNVNGTLDVEFGQPIVAIIYRGQQYDVPLSCVWFNGKRYEFPEGKYKGCLRIIPYIANNGQIDFIGTALFLTEKVEKTLFAHMYLMDEEWEGFKLVYDDSQAIPLAVYNGRLIGPLKIWEINYPNRLKNYKNPDYLSTIYVDKRLI